MKLNKILKILQIKNQKFLKINLKLSKTFKQKIKSFKNQKYIMISINYNLRIMINQKSCKKILKE